VKPFCIVDTCSLIYLSEIELAGRPLHRWLWEEFNVGYSQAVWEEIKLHAAKMGRDAKIIKRNGEKYVEKLPIVISYENALFGPPFYRSIQTGQCRQCRRPFFGRVEFQPNLASEKDKGERHNCCIALDAVIAGRQRQVIFLTDDVHAIRDYVRPVLETFPLGHIWSSHDFVLYLFVRHRKRIPQDEAKAALRDVNAKAAGSGFSGQRADAQQKWMRRLREYHGKVERIGQVLGRITGGY
jgi:hypothetical protein